MDVPRRDKLVASRDNPGGESKDAEVLGHRRRLYRSVVLREAHWGDPNVLGGLAVV